MHVRDSLHGYIELDKEEERLLDLPEMQRLRRIKQMGLTNLVYPGATHSRFEHSLGVMHVAGKFAESLGLDDERRKELRTAGLLHDLGHGPFSHASEKVVQDHGYSHEDFSCRKIDRLEDEFSADTDRVKKIIRGELEMGQVVAGEIDSDRIDYLQRDSHETGVEYGQIDADTIIRLAGIDSRRLVFDYKAVQALESLLTARFHMIKAVYTHSASQKAEKMLERALERMVEDDVGPEEMMLMDDHEAHSHLLDQGGRAEKLYSKIKDRELYKTALKWDVDRVSRDQLRELEESIESPVELEAEIADEAGLDEHQVLIDKPWTPEIQEMDVKVKKSGRVRNLEKFSPIPEALTEAEWRLVHMSVYCPRGHRGTVKAVAEEVLQDHMSSP